MKCESVDQKQRVRQLGMTSLENAKDIWYVDLFIASETDSESLSISSDLRVFSKCPCFCHCLFCIFVWPLGQFERSHHIRVAQRGEQWLMVLETILVSTLVYRWYHPHCPPAPWSVCKLASSPSLLRGR